jgi:arsenate reductase
MDIPPRIGDHAGVAPSKKPILLFVCVHNAGRSVMAAAFARRLGGDRVTVFSGGSAPAEALHPEVIQVMREEGIDLGAEKPRRFAGSDLATADVVITMGCGEACPVFPGKRYEDWQVVDPEGQPLYRVRAVRDAVKDKVTDLLLSLGIRLS